MILYFIIYFIHGVVPFTIIIFALEVQIPWMFTSMEFHEFAMDEVVLMKFYGHKIHG
jgi:hypothetical protein